MKLYISGTSPFARKVMILIKVHGLEEKIQFEVLHPIKEADDLRAVNPLCKVPALLIKNKELLIDSPIICRYLDDLALELKKASSLISPSSVPARRVTQLEAFADGIMAAGYLNVMERLRPQEKQSEMWIERWSEAVLGTVGYIESDFLRELNIEEHHLGQIAVASALGYLDFRMDYLGWRNQAPKLSAWFEIYAKREVFVSSAPVE